MQRKHTDLYVSSNDLLHLTSVPEHVGSHDSTAQNSFPVVVLLSRQSFNVLLQPLPQAIKLAH